MSLTAPEIPVISKNAVCRLNFSAFPLLMYLFINIMYGGSVPINKYYCPSPVNKDKKKSKINK